MLRLIRPRVAAHLILCACLLACLPLRAGEPEGRQVLRNGDLRGDRKHPVDWVIRETEGLSRSSLTPPEEGQESGVLSFEISTASARPWDVELRQSLAAPLRKGETLYISFDVKVTRGYSLNCYWQQDSPPWPKLLSARIAEPVDQWHTCTMAVPVQSDFGPRQTSLCFHLAAATGTVQLRALSAIALPIGAPIIGLPVNCDTVFDGDYQDRDWEKTVLDRLQTVRRADLTVRVTREGKAVPGRAVTIQQKSRPFFIGAEVSALFLAEEANAPPVPEELRRAIEGVKDRIGGYRTTILDRHLFDVISPRDLLVWRENQAWGDAFAPVLIGQALAQGLRVRGHALYSPAFSWAPPDRRQMQAAQLRESLEKYIAEQVSKYRGKVFQWDVVHAPLTNDEMYARLGEGSVVSAFKIARQQDPTATLVLSDDKALVAVGTEHLEELLQLVQWLRAEGGPADAIALQLTMAAPFVSPQTIGKRLDRIAEATGLPIVITSLAVDSAEENTQAYILEKLLDLFFSHPAVTGVCFAGVWEAEKGAERSALFRRDLTPKPAAKVLEKLAAREWLTDLTMKTDAAGSVATSAFQGSYMIAVDDQGRQVSREATVSKGGAEVVVELQK
jgi:GH35 family endo-1,4-beta-xylanase